MEKTKLQLNVVNLTLDITSYLGYINNEYPDECFNLCKPIEKLTELKNNPTEYKLGMAVYHKDVYNGNEPLEIVGIREYELELRGDYSGMYNIISDCWLPIEGVLLKKNND